jgi:hypothetical protein
VTPDADTTPTASATAATAAAVDAAMQQDVALYFDMAREDDDSESWVAVDSSSQWRMDQSIQSNASGLSFTSPRA